MATIQHIIHYEANNFTNLLLLVDCFITSIPSATLVKFEAEETNGRWRATLNYNGAFIDTISCIIPVGFTARIECLYPAELLAPNPLKTDYTVLVNGSEKEVLSLVLLGGTETLRLNMTADDFKAGDTVTLSFCNSQGMNVSGDLCNSFAKFPVQNNLI